DAGYLGLFAGGLVSTGNGPAQADHVVFGQGGARLDVNIVELSADAIVEVGEFLWAADGSMTFVEDTVLVEQLKNGVATGLIPDFVKPAQGESLVVFESGNGLRGGHGVASWSSKVYRVAWGRKAKTKPSHTPIYGGGYRSLGRTANTC